MSWVGTVRDRTEEARISWTLFWTGTAREMYKFSRLLSTPRLFELANRQIRYRLFAGLNAIFFMYAVTGPWYGLMMRGILDDITELPTQQSNQKPGIFKSCSMMRILQICFSYHRRQRLNVAEVISTITPDFLVNRAQVYRNFQINWCHR